MSLSSKRILVFCTLIVFLFIFYLSSSLYYSGTTQHKRCLLPKFISNYKKSDHKVFTDLNLITSSPYGRKEKLLVLTPLKDAEPYLERYFELLDGTTYPNELISLAFLVSDSSDNTVAALESHIHRIQSRSTWFGKSHSFASVRIFKKDFEFNLSGEERHKYEMQPLRRSIMARSRNWLLTAALTPDIAWVAWVDVDVVHYPATIFGDLMRADVDVVVPNCLLKREDNEFWAYDKNNWQETDASRRIQEDLNADFVLLEGYYEFPTYRYLMVDMPTEVGLDYKVPLDGVGATFTLVKAHVHREGAMFPPFTFQHQVETEGFAKIAKAMGFSVYGLPGYLIYHVQNH
ncbi:Anp1-domain-containing protein [Mucor mucedo]|uniref:Anp1-domain-containing protein n=1 Tax=Mucor mucedo TaxID=29922 RepID=UPI00221F546F|nr:Anp1-domain-containing protein [Mucor mucedo]KAI7881194.1 Anp1-domain-containing protein [Mucor mucedo]